MYSFKSIQLLIPISCLLFSNSYAISEKNYSNKYECQFEFDLNKSNVDSNFISSCLENVKNNENVFSIKVLASANLKGSKHYNEKLSKERLENTIEIITQKLPNLDSKELISVGKSGEYGKKVYITLYTKEKEIPSHVSDSNLNNHNQSTAASEPTEHNHKATAQKNNSDYQKEEPPYKLDYKRE
ncbi:hypothetical protein QEJ31_01345 [Pigmentibacter sp. JX0631]|uniref:hypothetical protein n=1 Tax=Pigmentibacter sp. JX0631 TaxID=2976982 RepID=UPI00246909F5|nr:hypothetical protein [Pigmentibacter sp. JX0631]WGL60249.1 hypothetical protein QEJ31_01345 [Pigmentibacter sp. JX0631]